MDTLMALRHAREQGSMVLSICNTQVASIPRESRCRQIIDSLKGMPAKIQWVLDTQAGTAR